MSMISEQIKRLREKADTFERSESAVDGIVKEFRQAADTIEELSAKLHNANMERSSAYYNNGWIPVSERLPSKEECKEWIDKNLGGIGYLYPCLVTRYSSINPDRTKNNPYVAKHYYDGEDFVHNGEEVCSEYIIAWMPLPLPYKANPTGAEEENE